MRGLSKIILIIAGIVIFGGAAVILGFLNSKKSNLTQNKPSENQEIEQSSKGKKRELLPEDKGEDRNKIDSQENDPLKQDILKSEDEINPQNPKIKALNNVQIGRRYKLNVVTQAQQKWYWCAPTTVSMILAARGKNISQSQLAGEMGTYEPFGTHNREAIRVLNRYMFGYDFPKGDQAGYRIETVRDKSPETIKRLKERIIQNTKDGYPIYFTFNPGKIYSGVKNAEHNVAGSGYIATPDDKDIAFIYYVDPYSKFHDKTYGGLKIVTPEELIDAMVDPYVTEPNYAW